MGAPSQGAAQALGNYLVLFGSHSRDETGAECIVHKDAEGENGPF